MRYVCLKPIIDTRDKKNVIKSRIGIERECLWIYLDTNLYALAEELFEQNMTVIDWFLVDEAQFLSTEQVDQLARIVDDFGSNVICYGLRTDFQSHLFEGSKDYLRLPTRLTKSSQHAIAAENHNQCPN